MRRVIPPNPNASIVDDNGWMNQRFRTFIKALAGQSLIIGSGNPENAVEAGQGAFYMDESATTGDLLYMKRVSDISGNKTQGWRAV